MAKASPAKAKGVTKPKRIAAPMGRPSKYSNAMADRICERLVNGESLRAICRDGKMPDASTVFRWLRSRPSFREQYARAKEEQADTLADDILDIADNAENDWMASNSPGNKGWAINGEAVQRSKLRIDARKWLAGKMKPKKYGEKVDVNHASDDGSMAPKPAVSINPADLSTEALRELVAAMTKKPGAVE